MTTQLSKNPSPDQAENNAFFPSPFSLSQFTSAKSDLSDANYTKTYSGKQKILVICADERYLPTDTGKFFSTGNHPVETLLPMYHLHKAGFDFEIATLSGLMVKFEYWAMPQEDTEVLGLYQKYLSQFRSPIKLADITQNLSIKDYAAVFIPGGHGALMGLPNSEDVAKLIRWTLAEDKFLISICHGPAAFVALSNGDNPLKGYSICAFPDAADKQTPDIGYMPGNLTWFFGEKLKALGLTLVNDDITGAVYKDRKVLTGDSPFAANALGKLAAKELLAAYTE